MHNSGSLKIQFLRPQRKQSGRFDKLATVDGTPEIRDAVMALITFYGFVKLCFDGVSGRTCFKPPD